MSKIYVAYGSNLNKNQMMTRCPEAKVYDKGIIKNHRLEFRGMEGNAHLTISEKVGSELLVGLFEISETDEKHLDRYEGYPNYYIKENVEVETENNGVIKAMAYIMVDGRKLNLPSDVYMKTCINGYKDFDFDTENLLKAYKLSNSKLADRHLKRLL